MESLRTQCEKRHNFSHYLGLLNIKVETQHNYILQITKEKENERKIKTVKKLVTGVFFIIHSSVSIGFVILQGSKKNHYQTFATKVYVWGVL